jgi:hypothetical protein
MSRRYKALAKVADDHFEAGNIPAATIKYRRRRGKPVYTEA